jgi:hypothetical protein
MRLTIVKVRRRRVSLVLTLAAGILLGARWQTSHMPPNRIRNPQATAALLAGQPPSGPCGAHHATEPPSRVATRHLEGYLSHIASTD